MIEHVLDVLPESEVNKVLIAAGYGIEQMRDYFSNLDLPYEVVIVEETEPLELGERLRIVVLTCQMAPSV